LSALNRSIYSWRILFEQQQDIGRRAMAADALAFMHDLQ
jgi:hypothetical protein